MKMYSFKASRSSFSRTTQRLSSFVRGGVTPGWCSREMRVLVSMDVWFRSSGSLTPSSLTPSVPSCTMLQWKTASYASSVMEPFSTPYGTVLIGLLIWVSERYGCEIYWHFTHSVDAGVQLYWLRWGHARKLTENESSASYEKGWKIKREKRKHTRRHKHTHLERNCQKLGCSLTFDKT